jgi:hypothetical protein
VVFWLYAGPGMLLLKKVWSNPCADLWYDVADSDHIIAVGPDADIRELVASTAPQGDWSPHHKVTVRPGSTYMVWSWDNQFFEFTVTGFTVDRVTFDWVMVDEGARHALRCGEREGIVHKQERRDIFFR